MSVLWLSGRFMAEEDGARPATRSRLALARGVFETLRVVGGAAPLIDLHVARLRGACAELGLGAPAADLDEVVRELAARNGLRDAAARICVGEDVALVKVRRLPPELGRERREGVTLTTARVAHAAPHLKRTSRRALDFAEREAGGEVLLRDGHGGLLESSRANLFVLDADGLRTAAPPAVLPGIARALVLGFACELGIPIAPEAPRLDRRDGWRECFLTNALRGLRPVVAIDGDPLPLPASGALTWRLGKALDLRMGS